MVRDVLTLNTFAKRALVSLLVLVVCFISLYIFFVQQTVMYVVERKTAEQRHEVLNMQVSELAAEYLFLKENITQERATNLGFRDDSNALFVSSRPDTAVSMNVIR